MLGLFKKPKPTPRTLPRYADVFETLRYAPPEDAPRFLLPSVYAFRTRPHVQTPDPRPSFALLETDDEISDWHKVLAEPVVLDANGHVSDLPLLHWNEVPSLLASEHAIVAIYTPSRDAGAWPELHLKAHPPEAELNDSPARDRYYFEQTEKLIRYL